MNDDATRTRDVSSPPRTRCELLKRLLDGKDYLALLSQGALCCATWRRCKLTPIERQLRAANNSYRP